MSTKRGVSIEDVPTQQGFVGTDDKIGFFEQNNPNNPFANVMGMTPPLGMNLLEPNSLGVGGVSDNFAEAMIASVGVSVLWTGLFASFEHFVRMVPHHILWNRPIDRRSVRAAAMHIWPNRNLLRGTMKKTFTGPFLTATAGAGGLTILMMLNYRLCGPLYNFLSIPMEVGGPLTTFMTGILAARIVRQKSRTAFIAATGATSIGMYFIYTGRLFPFYISDDPDGRYARNVEKEIEIWNFGRKKGIEPSKNKSDTGTVL